MMAELCLCWCGKDTGLSWAEIICLAVGLGRKHAEGTVGIASLLFHGR